jgi:hypothetical protein
MAPDPTTDEILETRPQNELRLKLPFVIYLSAPRGSGKTHLLLNLLISDFFYNDLFDKIYFVCPSFFQDPKYGILDLPSSQVLTEYNEKKIEAIIKSKKEDDEYLFVFDDCITQASFKSNTNDQVLNTIAVNGRHMGVSMIIASQKTSGSSSFIRSQADGVYIWKPRSRNEIEAIYEDNSIGTLTKKEFIDLLDYCTNEKYSHMFINYQNGEVYKNNNKIKINSAEKFVKLK